jgi:transposase
MSIAPAASPAPAPLVLSETDRARLQTFVHRGHASARTHTRAQVLLKLGAGWSEAEAGVAFDVCRNTVKRVRARFLEGGVDAVLSDKPQERRRQALTGAQQAHLIAIACSAVPEGHDHWTLRMLAGRAVELGFVPSVSPETIRALLRRTSSSRGSTASGASRR